MRLLMLAVALFMVYGLAKAWLAVRLQRRLNRRDVEWKDSWNPKE